MSTCDEQRSGARHRSLISCVIAEPAERFIPRQCVWETTRRCNLDCLHCGSRAGGPRGTELDTDEAIGLVDDLAELGCERVILSGGEPLLREDLAELVRHVERRGMKAGLISNGLALPDRIGELDGLPLHSAAVSLDGLEETHNRLRRSRESFGRAVESLRLLARLFVDVYVVTQVNRWNHPELEGLHRLISGLGVDGWQIQLTSDMGRAEDVAGLLLDRPRIKQLLDFILEKEGGPVKIYPGDDLGYHRRGRFRFGGCRAGVSVVGIEADGGVKPCLSMQKSSAADSIRRRPLKEIWRDPGFAAFNRGERRLSGRCAACRHRGCCRGGCVGTAAAYGASDGYPFCVQEA